MSGMIDVEETSKLYEALKKDAESAGYHLNPDAGFAKQVAKGLLTNQGRYGFMSCPCRLGTGKIEEDKDIVCPCDYRDDDVSQYGSCYCGFYVSDKVFKGEQKFRPLPDRRLPPEARKAVPVKSAASMPAQLSYPVWRCKVCGYICAREAAPGICPICKAKDRFERFI